MDNREAIEGGIRRFVDIVVSEFDPEKIILFGSYAKETYTENSDIDIAVVVHEVEGSFIEKETRLFEIRRGIHANIEPILIEEKSDKSGFLKHISSYGEVLFTRWKTNIIAWH